MKILVTGGAGFIGSHLSFELESLGHAVTIFDNFTTGKMDHLAGFRGDIIDGDIRDGSKIEPSIQKSDVVIHLAAALGVDNIMKKPLESMSINISGSEKVLTAASKYRKQIVIASTSEIYGKNPKQPLREEDDRVIGSPQNIRWSYSDAKAIEEAMAKALSISEGLEVTTIRFFNTVGPKQTGKYGMVVPRFAQSAILGRDLQVYGDGTQSRVFCHVKDAVAGLISVIGKRECIGEVFNVGGEGEVTIESLANQIITKVGSKSKIKKIPYSEAYPQGFEDMQRRVPDTSKLRHFTKWAPTHNLDKIISDVIEYFQSK